MIKNNKGDLLMKNVVINGKVYNTKKAEIAGEWNNGRFPCDVHYCEETLS